jgi:hypothetical protein
MVEDIPHLCRIDGVFDMWEDLVGASHIDNGLGIVLSFSPVWQFGTALPGIALWLRLFCSHDLVSVCSHDYSPHFLFPHGVVVFGQLRDVAVRALESIGSHCAGRWSFRGFEGRQRGRSCRGSSCQWEDGGFRGPGEGGRLVISRFRRSL